jgi:hypothetical protein
MALPAAAGGRSRVLQVFVVVVEMNENNGAVYSF